MCFIYIICSNASIRTRLSENTQNLQTSYTTRYDSILLMVLSEKAQNLQERLALCTIQKEKCMYLGN